MTIRYRSMCPGDLRECVEIVAAHPVLASRYGNAIRDLSPGWLKLLNSDAFYGTVFEDIQNSKCEVLGAGVAAFVTDDFIRELKCRPFWVGVELAVRIARGESPLLTDKQVRAANSRGGLNLAVWQTGVRPENLVRYEVGVAIMAAFVDLFRGFLLKESVTQAETLEHVGALCLTGGLLWNISGGSYQAFSNIDSAELISKPHVIGLSRELASNNLGSWAGSMFLYQPPRFGFSRSEQRLLLAASHGATDQEMGNELEFRSQPSKKTWRLIYDRVAACSPDLIPHSSENGDGLAERGREKKQRLIAYLRDHPEELRPVSRKLLRQAADAEVKAVR